jgi:hypothetical protein
LPQPTTHDTFYGLIRESPDVTRMSLSCESD